MDPYIKKLLKYKEFLKYGIISRIKVLKNSFFLGYFWWLFDPIINLIIYLFLVRIIFKMNDPSYVYYLAPAILSWSWFSSSVKSCCNIYENNNNLVKHFNFPKIILPLQEVILNTINFMISITLVVVIFLFCGRRFDFHISLLIIGIIIQFIFTLGICILVAHINIYVKDSEKFVNYGLLIWFYISPILYSIHKVPERFQFLFGLNPFTTIISIYRDSMLFDQTSGITRMTVLTIISVILIVIGIKITEKYEGDYAKNL